MLVELKLCSPRLRYADKRPHLLRPLAQKQVTINTKLTLELLSDLDR